MATIDPTKTIDDICNWHEMKAERGELSTNTARLRNTALRMLASPLAEDEPKTAEFVRENLPSLVKRWATLNPQFKADTATSYMSRAKAALEDYLRWQENPAGFRFAESAPRAPRQPKAAKTPTPPPAVAKNEGGIPDAEWEPAPSGSVTNTFRLANGRFFRFTMPEDISITEIARIAAHLATYSPEWTPVMPVTPTPPSTAIVPVE